MDTLLRRREMIASGATPTPPTPPGVVFYDKLVFDGTAYIDTDIIPDALASYRVILGNETTKAAQRYFAVQADNTTTIGIFLSSNTTSTNRNFAVYYGASQAVSTNRNMNFSYATMALWMTPYKFGFGSNSYSFTKGSNAPVGGLVLGMNAGHTGQPFTGEMETFRVYGSDAQNVTSNTEFNSYTPAYTLRPCTYNGEAGMWCVETSTFYGNTAGAGTLSVENNS